MPFRDQRMTDRQRFQAIMHYQPFDRGMIQDFQAWNETADVWHAYGLPGDVTRRGWQEFFGFDPFWRSVGAETLLWPALEEKVLTDEGQTLVLQQSDGSIVRRHKYAGSIPMHLDHLLKDRQSWERDFRWRLDPARADRVPADLAQRMLPHVQRDYPLGVPAGSLFGQLRNWMGLEGVSYIQYDDPELFEEMIGTIGDCIVGTLERVLAAAESVGLIYDYASMWEDMSYAQGPLLSVEKFRQHLVPQYKRITKLLRRHGCELVMLDSDGDTRLLLPHWLEGGVNIAFPLEIGTWGIDPLCIRRQFGRELRICGGFDKHILARGQEAITREIERLAPLVEQGGFIPFCDHRVPPDVPFQDYMHYVREARRVWGRDLDNLRPMGRPDRSAPRFGQAYEYQSLLAAQAPAAH